MNVGYYILTWDCTSENLKWLEEKLRESMSGKSPYFSWSVYNSKQVKNGDKTFFLRQRLEPRGIIGLGSVKKGPYPGKHWNKLYNEVLYVDVEWDYILEKPLISYEDLFALFPNIHWKTQRSGISCKDSGPDIEDLFLSRAHQQAGLPEEIPNRDAYNEGAKRTILVNSYERSITARQRCIDKWGYDCFVCEKNLKSIYGDVAASFIHVHHLTPLSEQQQPQTVDPQESPHFELR